MNLEKLYIRAVGPLFGWSQQWADKTLLWPLEMSNSSHLFIGRRHIWDISGTFLGHIWDISGTYLKYIWDTFGKYLGYIYDISWTYLGHIWDMFVLGIY